METLYPRTLSVYVTSGTERCHLHTGTFLPTRGLPPQLKADIVDVYRRSPRIKLSALLHCLFEPPKSWARTWRAQITHYHYNSRNRETTYLLGVSSFGTVTQLIETVRAAPCPPLHVTTITTTDGPRARHAPPGVRRNRPGAPDRSHHTPPSDPPAAR